MGRVYRLQAFQFDRAVCWVCPLRSQCIAAKGRQGRRVLIHPQEALLQEARALQQSAAYDEYRARRVVTKHRLARLVLLRIRQSRYFGRAEGRKRDSSCIWRPRWPTRPWCWAKSGCQAVLVAAQQATASSSMLSTLLSPMLRPIAALCGSDNYGPCFSSRRLYCRNPSTQPGLSGPVSRNTNRALLLAAAAVIILVAGTVTGLAYSVGTVKHNDLVDLPHPPSVAERTHQSRVPTPPPILQLD